MSDSPVPAGEDDSDAEERQLIQFAQAKEFIDLLLSDDFFPGGLMVASLQSLGTPEAESSQSVAKRERVLRRLTSILDEYQEQSYLLDPHLEKIVTPVVNALQEVVRERRGTLVNSTAAIQNLYRLLYHYTKVRGHKTISHFFPHAVEDLLPTLKQLEDVQEASTDSIWEMRYIQLLWLSLICMIPFDLHKFDFGQSTTVASTASRIHIVGRSFLTSSGKERDAASILLTRLFQRKDACGDDLNSFLAWAKEALITSMEPSIFLATGILQTICGVVKATSPEALAPHTSDIRTIVALYSTDIEEVKQASGRQEIKQPFRYSSNSVVNRYKSKVSCRLGMKLLRPRKQKISSAIALMGLEKSVPRGVDEADVLDEDEDVPEEIDGYIASLLGALQDKDTIVRYSAAKGISRLCSRLPSSFVEQVSEAIVDMFSVNIVDILGKREDLSNVSEFTWQGCCLALAELARRGLLSKDGIVDKLQWVEKALTFDIRRGAHSVGTGVRDAACYVLWAIARAHRPEAIQPMAKQLSHTLVCVALLDRDISIRRAASAAYQECVGRLGLFENGIDIIRLTDFYAVGNRRNAFLQCVTQVAVYVEYREALLEHLLTRTIIHWDSTMRELGAGAIAKIASLSSSELVPNLIKRVKLLCKSTDSSILHGALCTLAELARVSSQDTHDAEAWSTSTCESLQLIPRLILRPRASAMVISAACRLLASSATREALQYQGEALVWYELIDAALKRQEEDVQIAAAEAMAVVSQILDCTSRIDKIITDWKGLSISQQQSSVRMLGRLCYHRHGSSLSPVIRFLTLVVQPPSSSYSNNIETRRNAFESMSEAPATLESRTDEIFVRDDLHIILGMMLIGLEDYTSDARGDVGSWIRLACLTGMRKLLGLLLMQSKRPLDYWLDQTLCNTILAGFCKQMVERMDGLRAHAAKECVTIFSWFTDPSLELHNLIFPGMQVFEELFQRSDDTVFRDPAWLLPKVVHLLLIPEYRKEVLKGIVLCIGGQKEMINRTLANSLGIFLLDQSDSSYNGVGFSSDLLQLTMDNVKSNRYFIPCIQTFNVLFEEGVVEAALQDSEIGRGNLNKALEVACRNIKSVKSVARVVAASQYTINLLSVVDLRQAALQKIPAFLLHTFPTVRASTAELFYSAAQDHLDELTEEAEEIFLFTQWSRMELEELRPIVDKLISSLQSIHADEINIW